MITLNQFLAGIDANIARIRAYKLGCDGADGYCDCIGLIIGAVRLAGGAWPWTHGSNYPARYLLDGVTQTNAPLQLGDLVFKGRAPGEKGYDLPSRYKGSGDLIDYYHVGVVTSVDPLCITHCTSVPGGIKRDTSRGAWKYSGWLKIVEREGKKMTETITSPNGGKVNLRQSASLSAAIVAQLPPGAEVTVLGSTNTGWTRVQYGAKTGYVMAQFLGAGMADEAGAAQRAQLAALLDGIIEDAQLARDLLGKI